MSFSLLKKTFAAVLAALTAFSCVACGGGGNGDEGNNTPTGDPKATVYMLKEATDFMMGFVIVTDKDNVIIVDGGRPLDMPNIKQYVGGRKIKAWILTHPHNDHISGFISEMEKNGGADFDIEKIYYNFPDYDELMLKTADEVPDLAYFQADLSESLPAFNAIKHKFADKEHIAKQGQRVKIDDLQIDFIFSYKSDRAYKLYANPMNDASLVFKINSPKTSILFLGDLGPEGGDVLLRESRWKLKSDIVQMAHHGHMTVGMDVYAEIDAKVCLWSAPIWLYEESADMGVTQQWLNASPNCRYRMYGTAVTRQWMDALGVKTHLVSGYGTQTVYLY